MGGPEADKSASIAPVRAIPPRYWWLKRIPLAGVFLLVAVGVLRWGVDRIAARRLSARVAAIQAAGEPILPTDFNVEPVPEEENAVILLAEAAEKFVELNPDKRDWQTRLTEGVVARLAGKPLPPRPVTIDDILEDPALLDANFDTVERLLHDNAEALRLLHEARFRPAADWGLRFDDSIVDVKLPNLSRYRELANLACVAALVAHRKGDDVAAIGCLRDVLAHAERVSAQPHLLGSLMGIMMSATAAETLQEILPGLQFDGTQAGADAIPAALRVELENVIEVFLTDEAFREAVVLGFQFERAMCLDAVRMVTESGMHGPVLDDLGWSRKTLSRIAAYLDRPLFRLEGVRMLDAMTAEIRSCRARLLGGEAEPGPDLSGFRFDSVLDRRTALVSALVLPQFGGTIEGAARYLSKLHLAATGIAIRLYELDHGRRPATLDQLVPDYLPSVPVDPLSESAEPIHYIPDGPNARLELKSQMSEPQSDEMNPSQQRFARDKTIVFRLAPRVDTRASSSQPSSVERVDQHNDVEREPGQANDDEATDKEP